MGYASLVVSANRIWSSVSGQFETSVRCLDAKYARPGLAFDAMASAAYLQGLGEMLWKGPSIHCCCMRTVRMPAQDERS